ncbi:MAG: tRNA (N6-isopentenyl adenosine(37)-C2)-methylthiotransferase MiaB [Clostridia bacterium]|nr:tRNA (N6-isopentenyl adenosine(37)-C2)-methylthiotransferase MiaB [Clostridia bacterium]
MKEKPLRLHKYIEEVRRINLGSRKTYQIRTFGCQMNENDSEKIAGVLEEMGYLAASDNEIPDFILFNTCCVRENAEQKVFGHLGVLKKQKEKKESLIIALCGCMMQQAGTLDKIKKSYRHADIVYGTNKSHLLPQYLYTLLTTGQKQYFAEPVDQEIIEGQPVKRESSIKAYVPIMYGCNNFCSYCVVPLVRGRERSRKKDDIINEINSLVAEGTKEVTLLGQNVNSYDSDGDFTELLYLIDRQCDIKRIRFMTSHPKDISSRLIQAIHDIDKVCNHLHLPLQSGSTKVLSEMNRKYDKDRYLAIISEAKQMVPEIGLSTDIIVGFPGETDDDFEDTLDVLEKCEFDFAYTFLYSKRRGTPAASRKDQITKEVKGERFEKLLEKQNSITLKKNLSFVGSTVKVLVEGASKTDKEILTGRDEANKIINFKGSPDLIGEIVNVKITSAKTWHLEGETNENI